MQNKVIASLNGWMGGGAAFPSWVGCVTEAEYWMNMLDGKTLVELWAGRA